jgi:hypothetical protein
MKQAMSLISAILLLGFTGTTAHALPFPAAQPSAPATGIVEVQANCVAVGQQVAARLGGQLGSVRMENRGGRNVCVGEVVVPPKDGQRGRKIPFEEPL